MTAIVDVCETLVLGDYYLYKFTEKKVMFCGTFEGVRKHSLATRQTKAPDKGRVWRLLKDAPTKTLI